MAGTVPALLQGAAGGMDMVTGGLVEGFNALVRAGTANQLYEQNQDSYGRLRDSAGGAADAVASANRRESSRLGSLWDSTGGNRNNPFFTTDPSRYTGPRSTLPTSAADARSQPYTGLRTDSAMQNYGNVYSEGQRSLQEVSDLSERAYSAVQSGGDAAIKDLVDTVGAGIQGFSASARETIDNMNLDIDSKVASGEIPPAAAEQMKQQARMQAGQNVQDQARQLISRRSEALAQTRLTTANQMSSTMASFGSTLGSMSANYMAALNSGAGLVSESQEADRAAAVQQQQFAANLISHDGDLERQSALTAHSLLAEAEAMNIQGNRDVASIMTGLALNPASFAGWSNTVGNSINAFNAANPPEQESATLW